MTDIVPGGRRMVATAAALFLLVCGVLVGTATPASADLGWWHFVNGTAHPGPCMVEDQGFFVKSATCNTSADRSQQWMLVVTDFGWHHVIDRQSGHCMGFNGHAGEFGQAAFTTQCSNGYPDIEFAVPTSLLGNNYFSLKSRVSGYCLQGQNSGDRAAYQLPCSSDPAQAWHLVGPYN